MLNFILFFIGIILNTLCLWSIRLVLNDSGSWNGSIKYLSGIPIGMLLSLLLFPNADIQAVLSILAGSALGEIVLLFHVIIKRHNNTDAMISWLNDSPMRIFITGDKHRRFEKVKYFCRKMNTKRHDVLIILGDAGFNYYGDKRDDKLKRKIAKLNITLFCIHGNKENRPQNVGTYGFRSFCGGKVYYEPKYPNIYFAIDGEIYTFDGKKYMVAGGAHSVDKMRCLEEGTPFWPDEMPSDAIKKSVEQKLHNEGNKIYGMLTHTCPIDYLPTEMFMSTRQNADIKKDERKVTTKRIFKPDIDRSTEMWLGELEKKINYEVWFCGHYHTDKQIDKIQMMHHDIRPLHLQSLGD
jgi:3-oxoacid CoA-transferase subunit A